MKELFKCCDLLEKLFFLPVFFLLIVILIVMNVDA